jgi:putative transposase
MSNHLHLLITPQSKKDLATFMQTMANRYVRYFNAKYDRTGTIWEGRFKSCLVESELYLLVLYKYIEMNPVKAGMVKCAEDYVWSSYLHNALGGEDCLITSHAHYNSLGNNNVHRYNAYKALFDTLVISSQQDEHISKATLTGEVYGSDLFHDKIRLLLSRVTRLGRHGGDRKSEDYKNQAG